MSRLDEIQKRYQGYVAAREAVKKTDPGEVKVVYKENEDGNRANDGIFVYHPESKLIAIYSRRNGNFISIKADDLPALVKALREFIE
jgi:hypothetical protein